MWRIKKKGLSRISNKAAENLSRLQAKINRSLFSATRILYTELGFQGETLNASLPGKVGGDCCQRDCHQVRGRENREQPSRHRSAGSVSLGQGKWPDGAVGAAKTSGCCEDGNELLPSNVSLRSHAVTLWTLRPNVVFCTFPPPAPLSLVSWKPAAASQLSRQPLITAERRPGGGRGTVVEARRGPRQRKVAR